MSDALAAGPDGLTRPRGRRRSVVAVVVVILATLVGAGLGYVALTVLPKTYRATSGVYVLPTTTALSTASSSASSSGSVQIETEAELLGSAQVADPAAAKLGGRLSAEDLLNGTSVEIPSNSEVLKVTVRAGTPALARDASMAMATSYLERRQKQATDIVAAETKRLDDSLAAAQKLLKANTDELNTATSDAQKVFAESQRTVYLEQITDIQSRLVQLEFAATTGGEIITAAQLPTRASSPSVPGTVGLGILLGLATGTGLVLLWQRTIARPRHAAGTASRFPVLAAVTVDEVAGLVNPATAKALLRLCGQIDAHDAEPGPIVLSGLGDPALRARFGVSLTQTWASGSPSGRSVFVLAEQGVELFAPGTVEERPGFADIILGQAPVGEAVDFLPGSQVGIVGPGRDDTEMPTPSRIQLLRAWLELERDFSTLFVQTSSVLDSTVAQAALTAGRIVVVVEAKIAQSREMTSMLEELEWLGLTDRVVGVVLVSYAGGTDEGADARAVRGARTSLPARQGDEATAPQGAAGSLAGGPAKSVTNGVPSGATNGATNGTVHAGTNGARPNGTAAGPEDVDDPFPPSRRTRAQGGIRERG